MTFEPFRSIVLSGQVPKLNAENSPKKPAPPANQAPPPPHASTIVERPGIGPDHSAPGNPERPESLHEGERTESVEEIVRPASTVVTKEWVFAQTQGDVDSALGHDGPREATISPAKIPAQRPVNPPPIEPRRTRVAPVPDLHMPPLPANGLREETTGGVPNLYESGEQGAQFAGGLIGAGGPPADPATAPRQFVVAYAGSLIGTYRGDARAENRTIFENVARQLSGQIAAFDPGEIRLFQLTEIPRTGAFRAAGTDGETESEFEATPAL